MSATTSERKHVLFVDDQQEILDGLRDALRSQRHTWQMSFVSDAEQALERMRTDAADVVVTDMRMPRIDGAELLGEVQAQYPDSIRIVLSGYADTSALTRAAAVAHRFLAKPADTDELVRVIERSLALHELSTQMSRNRTSTALSSLPSAPLAYVELTRMLNDDRASASDVAGVVEHDVAMSAKVLQLANSAFFGTGRSILQLSEAVTRLGMNNLRALTLSVGAFDSFTPDEPLPGFSISALQAHSTLVGQIARRIAPTGTGDDAFTAGMLHDVGQLILASQEPEYLAQVIATAEAEDRPLHEAEQAARGSTHAEIGAYLLDLWGIPHTIVEAVAYHHAPRAAHGALFDHVTAVHVADALADEVLPAGDEREQLPPARLDEEYLSVLGVADEVKRWRVIAREEAARLQPL